MVHSKGKLVNTKYFHGNGNSSAGEHSKKYMLAADNQEMQIKQGRGCNWPVEHML